MFMNTAENSNINFLRQSLSDKLDQLTVNELETISQVVDLILNIKNTNGVKTEPKQIDESEEIQLDSVVQLKKIIASYPSETKWTYQLLQEVIPFDYQAKVEIIHNQLYIMPNPSEIHQDIVLELATILKSFVKKNKLGKIIIAPFDVQLDENNVVVPDILYISLSRKEILDGKKAQGAPDLVVEVISPANYKKIREEKKGLYEQFGVQEYWEIYPKSKECLIYVLKEGNYELFNTIESNLVKSFVLEGFELNIQEFFQDVLGENNDTDSSIDS